MVNPEVLRQFMLPEANYELQPYGSGHINSTYLVCGGREKYILQKINVSVFPDVDGLMRNVSSVCDFNVRKTVAKGGDAERCLRPVKTKDGKNYCFFENGYYRVYNFIENTVSINIPLSAGHFGEGSACFARFAENLAEFDASSLTDVIPGFHDTGARVKKFEESAVKDKYGRKKEALPLAEFIYERSLSADVITNGLKRGDIPLRVTHNDTKFNNLLFDEKTKKPVAVIDLDTVMKGSVLYDFGDAIRTGCNPAEEDEKDLSKVVFLKDYYDAAINSYFAVLKNELTETEKNLFGFSAMLMTYECGVRFLTDYFDGDVYFRTHYDGQNLCRAKTQFRLVAEMEKVFGKMTEYAGR